MAMASLVTARRRCSYSRFLTFLSDQGFHALQMYAGPPPFFINNGPRAFKFISNFRSILVTLYNLLDDGSSLVQSGSRLALEGGCASDPRTTRKETTIRTKTWEPQVLEKKHNWATLAIEVGPLRSPRGKCRTRWDA